MFSIHSIDIHNFAVTVDDYDSLADALIAFEARRTDEKIGHMELWENGAVPELIKQHPPIEELCMIAPDKAGGDIATAVRKAIAGLRLL